MLHSNGKDDADVAARVKKATGAFASPNQALPLQGPSSGRT
jgi:hypothetical protein